MDIATYEKIYAINMKNCTLKLHALHIEHK